MVITEECEPLPEEKVVKVVEAAGDKVDVITADRLDDITADTVEVNEGGPVALPKALPVCSLLLAFSLLTLLETLRPVVGLPPTLPLLPGLPTPVKELTLLLLLLIKGDKVGRAGITCELEGVIVVLKGAATLPAAATLITPLVLMTVLGLPLRLEVTQVEGALEADLWEVSVTRN